MEEWLQIWEERIGKFAAAVGKSAEEITEALKEVAGDPGQAALEVLADESASPFEDLKSALSGLKIPIGVMRKNLALLRGAKEKPAETVQTQQAMMATEVLPPVPDDESFVAALKVGGELKIGPTEVIAAMKAALANRVGLYDLPDKLINAMEKQAENLDDPCPPSFYELQKSVTRSSYAEIFNALGIEGRFISEKRKNELLKRLDASMWHAMRDFHEQLLGWQQAWMAGAANPGMMMTVIAAGFAGAGNMALPPGMLQPPDTSPVRDASETFVNNVNKVFAGTGIPVARALAWDAQRIKRVIEDDRLPAAVGAANREQMLKILGVDVAADYVRLERNVVRYALAIMDLPKVTSGQSEYAYLAAMLQLGVSIPWEKLLGITPQK